MIIISSIKLAIDTYLDFDNSSTEAVSEFIDFGFTIIFAIESFFKIIAFGLFWDVGSYLRDSWSELDFLIVIISLIDLIFSGVELSFIKILRLLRILRPLRSLFLFFMINSVKNRFISHNENMKLVVMALMESVAGIINVVVVVLLIWFIHLLNTNC